MKTKIYYLLLLATGLMVNAAKTYAIADIEITTSSIALADVNQGALSVIVYAAKMVVTR